MTTHVAFVNPFPSPVYLANSLKAANIVTSVIYNNNIASSTDNIWLNSGLFDNAFNLENDEITPGFIETLREKKVDRIYYGSETVVEITDQLANIICPLYANPTDTASYRSNKFDMQEALRDCNVPAVKQIKVNDTLSASQQEELKTWQFPVIVKPSNSSGSVDVKRCDSWEKAIQYFVNQPKKNIYNLSILSWVIQEFLHGEEYIVDTFSDQGQVFLSGIQQVQRKYFNGSPICLYSETIPLNSPEAKICFEYVSKVLKVLQLNNGFGHTEIMLTKNGPYLIELNPRIAGAHGANSKLIQACGLPSQTDLLIASCNKEAMPIAYERKAAYGRKVLLQNFDEKILKPLNLTKLTTLDSFVEAWLLKTPGSVLHPVKSLRDAVGIVLLANENHQRMVEDYEQLIAWENSQELY